MLPEVFERLYCIIRCSAMAWVSRGQTLSWNSPLSVCVQGGGNPGRPEQR